MSSVEYVELDTSEVGDKLVFAEPQALKDELSLLDPKTITVNAEAEPELLKKANSVVDHLIEMNLDDLKQAQENKEAVETMGLSVQKKAAEQSALLKAPIGELSKRSDEGSDVANALIDLKMTVEDLDPTHFDFEPGWLSRLLGKLPFIGTPMKRYFTKFESSQTVLAAIEASLIKGQKQLERDNITLASDQISMRELTKALENAIKLAQLIDQRLVTRLEREIKPDDPKYKFIQEEILHPLRVRIQDLQQQLIVNQQAILTIEIIVRNNKELIRGVRRALNVTMNALSTAVVLAQALNHQKIVLRKITSLNETTDGLLAGTAKMLKEQTPQINKLASEASLNIETLKTAFKDIQSALSEISEFKQKALPSMAKNILEMDEMIGQQDKAIRDLEEGRSMTSNFIIEP